MIRNNVDSPVGGGDNLSAAYDSVVFREGNPPLDTELNLAQELSSDMIRKATAGLASGWLSHRKYFCDSSTPNTFFSQDPRGAKPEIAMVNGWPVYVTNTGTDMNHVNAIDLSGTELRSGTRVDGVFLEVWRSLITSENQGKSSEDMLSKPVADLGVSSVNSIDMVNEWSGWAVGDNGTILATVDGGSTWYSQQCPVKKNLNSVKFVDKYIGFACGNNGCVIKTIDGGSNWYIIDIDAKENLTSIALAGDVVVIVGDNGTILRSSDGEDFAYAGKSTGLSGKLNSVFFIDSNLGWVVGDKGAFGTTRDSGTTWERAVIIDSRSKSPIKTNLNSVVFSNYNDGIVCGDNGTILKTADSGFNWASVSDRIGTDDGYRSLSSIKPGKPINIRSISVENKFPANLTIGIHGESKNLFTDVMYEVSPNSHPDSLVLRFKGVSDGINYEKVIEFSEHKTVESIRDAINNIRSPHSADDINSENRADVRVFDATVDFASFTGGITDKARRAGYISKDSVSAIRLSVEDTIWAVGDTGIIMVSTNSGSTWELLDPGEIGAYKDIALFSGELGLIVGSAGEIASVSGSDKSSFTLTRVHTDLSIEAIGRVYPEGNILSEANNFIHDDIINPKVGVETSHRTQIQYRIRVVEGIDSVSYPDSGLSQPDVYGRGPNRTDLSAGEHPFINMGKINGDYGLYRATCKNTVGGYTWAIPMFIVTRKNSSPFDKNSNINGTTDMNLSSVRPDGTTHKDIEYSDITDVRRDINVRSYSSLVEKNLDLLLSNRLTTSIAGRDIGDGQRGHTPIAVDSFKGTDIKKVLKGVVNSEATEVTLSRSIDNRNIPTSSELMFQTIDKGLFSNDSSKYSAVLSDSSGAVVSTSFGGVWKGLGTKRVFYVISDDVLSMISSKNYTLKLTATYEDYSKKGLTHVPTECLISTYKPDQQSFDGMLHINSVGVGHDATIVQAGERVQGHRDFIEIIPPRPLSTDKELNLYSKAGDSSKKEVVEASLRRFNRQQRRGSLVQYHYFLVTDKPTKKLHIPKNVGGYFVFGVTSVRSVDGRKFPLSTGKDGIYAVEDREILVGGDSDISKLTINIDPAYTIHENTIVEVVLEVFMDPNSLADSSNDYLSFSNELGVEVDNRGMSEEARKTSMVMAVSPASKGVEGVYASVLVPVEVTGNMSRSIIELDLSNRVPKGLLGGSVLGLGSMSYGADDGWYIWSRQEGSLALTTVPVKKVVGIGTPKVKIYLSDGTSVPVGHILVPALIKLATLPGLSNGSELDIYYRYRTYQTVGHLPERLTVDIVKSPDFVYISNQGSGVSARRKGVPYTNPLEHIAVNDDEILNESFFSNSSDLDFSNFRVSSGFVKMPALISRQFGGSIELIRPNNVGDKLGRAYYTEASEDIVYQCESLTESSVRKVFVPMLARIQSDITSPFVRGELVLVIFSKVYKSRPDNITGHFDDVGDRDFDIETPDTAISLYRIENRPLVRV